MKSRASTLQVECQIENPVELTGVCCTGALECRLGEGVSYYNRDWL